MQHSQLDNLLWKFRQENSSSKHPSISLPKKRIHFKKRAAWASNQQLLEILKWTADFCKARQTVLQNTVFMPVLAKVSWQIGQLAFRITLQLMKQISFRQVISPALLLLALPPHVESILHNRDCAFRTQTSNSSRFLKARLSTTSYSHFCPMQGILKAQNSKLSPVAYDKKNQAMKTNRDLIFFWM